MKTGRVAASLKVMLDIVWYLGAASLGLFALLFVFGLFFDTTSLSTFSMEVGLSGLDIGKPSTIPGDNVALMLPVAFDAKAAALDGGRIEDVRAVVRLPVPSRSFFSISMAIMLAQFALGLWVVTQLRAVFRDVCAGQPFAAANAGRIRRVGFGVMLAAFVHAAAVFFWSYSSTALFNAQGARFVPMVDIDAGVILSGLVVLVIAEVFREGARLREEQSLTI